MPEELDVDDYEDEESAPGGRLSPHGVAAPVPIGNNDEDSDEEDEEDDIVMEVQAPYWLELVAGASGLRDLQYKIAVERAKRADELYQNPFPITNFIVTNLYFDVLIGFIIVLNCIALGWQASLPDGEAQGFFDAIEIVFAFIFVMEWCMRLVSFGWSWPFEFGNAVDTWLVFGTGIFLKPLAFFRVNVEGLRIYTALRALRLVRLAKAVRYEPSFKECWILVQGLMTSVNPMVWVTVIAVALLFTFGVLGTEIIGRSPIYADDPAAQELFGTLGKSIFTLMQLLTLDDWGDDIVRVVIEKNPVVMVIYFIGFIGIGVFVFWNLITAVVVDNAMGIASEDATQMAHDAERKKINDLRSLKDLFLSLDEDKSGKIDQDEFMSALKKKELQQQMDLLDLRVEEMAEVWDLLDDGDGELTIKEFTDGLRRMKGEAKAKDIFDCIKRMKRTFWLQDHLQNKVKVLCASMTELDKVAKRLSTDTEEISTMFLEMFYRLTVYREKGQREDRTQQQKRQVEQQRARHRAKSLAQRGSRRGSRVAENSDDEG